MIFLNEQVHIYVYVMLRKTCPDLYSIEGANFIKAASIKATFRGIKPIVTSISADNNEAEDNNKLSKKRDGFLYKISRFFKGSQKSLSKLTNIFEVFIDLDPLGKLVLSQEDFIVLRQMEKMLADRNDQGDVTFTFPGENSCIFSMRQLIVFYFVYIITDRRKIMAHSLVIACGSPVLEAMFHNDWKESLNRVVEIVDESPELFEQILQYLYIGTVKEMDAMAMDLLAAADKYQIEALKKECASFIGNKITIENVTSINAFANLHILVQNSFNPLLIL